MKKALLALAVALTVNSQCFAALLTPLTTFGGTDGWRAPKETVTGDVAGTGTPGNYTYLGLGNGERGIAFNPATGNLLLVSRPTTGGALAAAGTAPFVRVLNGTTGADLGGFNMTGVSGGGGAALNKIGVTTDGAIYADNIATSPAGAGPLRVYKWTSESSALTTGGNTASTLFSGAAIAGTTRLGDSMDVTGNDANVKLAFGNVNGNGYVTLNSSATATVVSTFTPNTTPTGPGTNAFGRGITFGATNNEVLGRGTESNLWVTQTDGTRTAAPGFIFTRQPIDYTFIQGTPYLAVVDINTTAGTTSAANRPIVYVFDMTDPSAPVLVASESTVATGITVAAAAAGTTAPISTAGGNGQVTWGASTVSGTDLLTTLYALTTNQGIQAFQFSVPLAAVPEVGAFAAVGFAGLLSAGAVWIRKRMGRATLDA